MTSFDVVFDAALSKLRDYDLADVPQAECYEILMPYFRSACAKFRLCRKDLTDRDDGLGSFNFDLGDTEVEILANGLIIDYIFANYIRVPLAMKMALPSRDFNSFSQANFLAGLLSLHDTAKRENERLAVDYSWAASALYEAGGGLV